MSLYHSITQIKNDYIYDAQSAHAYLDEVHKSLDTTGRELHAVRLTDADFAHQQIEYLVEHKQNDRLLSYVPLAHKELYARKPEHEKGWPFEAGSHSWEEIDNPNAFVIDALTPWCA